MVYESQISFTLDTICPWTYLAKKRLDEALRLVRLQEDSNKVSFTLHYLPYELYPEASRAGESKYEWYRKSRYGDSDEKMAMYTTLMSAYGASAGITYKFGGVVANTFEAHRVLQYVQATHGAAVADALVLSLYRQYFEEERHPSSKATLVSAMKEAGVEVGEAERVVGDEEVGARETRMKCREQRENGVDSVPYVVLEGRRRDLTLEGAREVGDYVKALLQIVKECE